MIRKILTAAACLLCLGLLAGCAGAATEPEETFFDPHAGMVEVADGAGGTMWIVPSEILPAASFDAADFTADGGYIDYNGSGFTALRGVDVSFYQGEIDWAAAAADGVEFAMIRLGYRGYGDGQMYEDELFRSNVEGALAAGLRVGAYFFSQAVSVHEAEQEAEFVISRLSGYDITLPVAFDWEPITFDEASRTMSVSGTIATACAEAFCGAVEDAGYEPAVYFFRSLGYHVYDLDRLAEYEFWVGALGGFPDFYYEHSMWQYSTTGAVAGIPSATDLDLYFVKDQQ